MFADKKRCSGKLLSTSFSIVYYGSRKFKGLSIAGVILSLWLGPFSILNAYRLGMLGEEPDWSSLDIYQNSLQREEFVRVLETVYLPYGYDERFISVNPGYVLIKQNGHDEDAYYRLNFAPWEPEMDMVKSESKVTASAARPLEGLVIAIDPGHIGGAYSEMEARHFQIGEAPPVKEGDLTLIVSERLKSALEAVGAKAILVRKDSEPVTERRPDDFWFQAEAIEQQFYLEQAGFVLENPPWTSEWFQKRIRNRAEMLFYRVSEIQRRAEIINQEIQPDLTLAVHFNVSPWLSEETQELPEENHMHVIVHGTYTAGELALDDVRLHLFQKLLSRNHEIEIPMSAAVADSLAKITELPPFSYAGKNASNQGENAYVWARNLLANRLYKGPVVFLEVYCTNSKSVYERIQLGDYEGLKEVRGELRQSLYAEYVQGVVEGLVDYFNGNR